MESGSNSSNSSKGVIVTIEKQTMKFKNPFSLKVGQVFTGFGIGCGLGIGVGRPLNLGAIPMLNQVMSATRGATDAFSGVGRHVNSSLRKVGVKGIEAGIGCGIGFGHGFGVGLAVKRGVVDQVQSYLIQAVTQLMMKSGMSNNILPSSLQAGMRTVDEGSNQNPLGVKVPLSSSPGLLTDRNTSSYSPDENDTSTTNVSSSNAPYSSRTEKVLSNFLQSPLLKDENSTANELSESLRSENNLLHIVLKHQQMIDELKQENEKLRQILVTDLKVSPSKLQTSYSSGSAGGEAGMVGAISGAVEAGGELTDGPGLIVVGGNATGDGGDINGDIAPMGGDAALDGGIVGA